MRREMPESEPKPRALEAITPGSPLGWKAVLKNGKQVVVHEIPATSAAAAAAIPRLQRLSEHPHPSLSPILAWGTEDGGVWVAVEPNEGTPLSSVLARGRFTPHAAAALGTSVLSGIAALHEAGIAMGGFDATAVRLTSNGEVRLAGHPVADRKSTRLNSSHANISYAVFCLKKKKDHQLQTELLGVLNTCVELGRECLRGEVRAHGAEAGVVQQPLELGNLLVEESVQFNLLV